MQFGLAADRAYVELLADDTKLVAGLKGAQRRLASFGQTATRMGTRTIAAAVAGAAPLAASAKAFATFEQNMAGIRALLKPTAKEFELLEAKALEMGKKTIFSASQSAEAMKFFALAGFKVKEVLDAIGPTLSMAAAGEIEIAEAADIATKIMRGSGIEAHELGGAVDVLTKAFTTANTDLRQLGDAMKFVGPIARTAGIGFHEIVAAVQSLSDAGQQADIAGTALRGVLLSLTNPSREAADLMQELGIRTLDASGDVRPLADIVEEFEKSLDGLGKGQRLAVMGKIFNNRQIAGFARLIDIGSTRLREMTKTLGDSVGTAKDIEKIKLDTLRGDFIILISNVQNLAIEIGRSLAPMLRKVTQDFIKFLGGFSDWVKANRGMATLAAGAVTALGAMGAALIAIGLASKLAAVGIGVLSASVVILQGVLKGFLFIFSKLFLVFLGKAFLWFTVAVAVGAVVKVAWELLKALERLTGVGSKLLSMFGSLGGKLKEWASGFTDLWRSAVAAFQGIKDALGAGDISLAAEILMKSMKIIFQTGLKSIQGVWDDWSKTVFRAFANVAKGLLVIRRALSGDTLEQEQRAHDALVERGLIPTDTPRPEDPITNQIKEINKTLSDMEEGFAEAAKQSGKSIEQLKKDLEDLNKKAADLNKQRIADEEKTNEALKQRASEGVGDFGDIGDTIKGSIFSTFFARPEMAFGPGQSAAEETAKNTRKIADNTSKMLRGDGAGPAGAPGARRPDALSFRQEQQRKRDAFERNKASRKEAFERQKRERQEETERLKRAREEVRQRKRGPSIQDMAAQTAMAFTGAPVTGIGALVSHIAAAVARTGPREPSVEEAELALEEARRRAQTTAQLAAVGPEEERKRFEAELESDVRAVAAARKALEAARRRETTRGAAVGLPGAALVAGRPGQPSQQEPLDREDELRRKLEEARARLVQAQRSVDMFEKLHFEGGQTRGRGIAIGKMERAQEEFRQAQQELRNFHLEAEKNEPTPEERAWWEAENRRRQAHNRRIDEKERRDAILRQMEEERRAKGVRHKIPIEAADLLPEAVKQGRVTDLDFSQSFIDRTAPTLQSLEDLQRTIEDRIRGLQSGSLLPDFGGAMGSIIRDEAKERAREKSLEETAANTSGRGPIVKSIEELTRTVERTQPVFV